MKDVKWANNLKLRASYGETGNDNILDSNCSSRNMMKTCGMKIIIFLKPQQKLQ